jgi:hypothetical protein
MGIRFPEDGTWSSFFSSGEFDDAGSPLLGVTNVTTGTLSATGDPSVFIDNNEVELESGGGIVSGNWEVEFSSDPAFRFQQQTLNFEYPALTGDEVISISGSGAFDIGTGDFATNFNLGSYNLSGTSGIDFQVKSVQHLLFQPQYQAIFGYSLLLS